MPALLSLCFASEKIEWLVSRRALGWGFGLLWLLQSRMDRRGHGLSFRMAIVRSTPCTCKLTTEDVQRSSCSLVRWLLAEKYIIQVPGTECISVFLYYFLYIFFPCTMWNAHVELLPIQEEITAGCSAEIPTVETHTLVHDITKPCALPLNS
jgi:hypothetical protein